STRSPPGLRTNAPWYPRREGGKNSSAGVALVQMPQSFLPRASPMHQMGFGRPEKRRTPAAHPGRVALRDLDVPMHDDHEAAEVGVTAAIGGARVSDRVHAVVDVGGLGSTRLVCPVPVPALPVPVEVPARADDERHEVSFLGALVGSRRAKQLVGNGSGSDVGT